jgi:hypothetical protein
LTFRGKAFPALGELAAFAAAAFLADTFVDLNAVAAGTTERAGRTLEVAPQYSILGEPAIREPDPVVGLATDA